MATKATRLVRASISASEHDRIRVRAIRAGVSVQDYAAEVIRAGLKALNGRGEK